MSIGDYTFFINLLSGVSGSAGSFLANFGLLYENNLYMDHFFDIQNLPKKIEDPMDPKKIPSFPFPPRIEFKNVSFSYHQDDQYALKDINVVIPHGTTCALVGRSGSGKTTFINLLLRSYDPDRGKILIDDIDIKTVTQASLRAQIAVVPQEVDLFSRTVSQNIAYGQENTSKAKVENAAKTALAHDFILKLEDGYDTVVGERGIKLSGGERQRVGIARAVLRDPKILILDEATSHLDTESEQIITRATDALVKNRTSLIIAHRLSTVIHADKILVFNEGRIEAEGTHTELLRSSKTYKRLHSLQFEED